MIRVVIAGVSADQRRDIARRLAAVAIRVVGEAHDGLSAVAETQRQRPDVVLVDLGTPIADGLDTTRRIMAEVPTPVLVLTGCAESEDERHTSDVLAAGALEVCAKPLPGSPHEQADWERIVSTIAAAALVCPMRRPMREGAPETMSSVHLPPRAAKRLVVIGASTGGPPALRKILSSLAEDFPVPVLIALHCNRRLSASIASWFDRDCALRVRDAKSGQSLPESGTVLAAPPGFHLSVHARRLWLTEASDDGSCSPSVDTLFESAADAYGEATVGVLLTGMGTDGAKGLLRVRQAGGCTLAQDEASCAVFGMPGAAIRLGAVENVVPLDRVADFLTRITLRSPGEPMKR